MNITSYRELPARMRIIHPEGSELPPAQRYLQRIDESMRCVEKPNADTDAPPDLVSLVFANQLGEHSISSYHLAKMIVDREAMGTKQLEDIQWRFDELWKRKPLRPSGMAQSEDDGKLTDVEKQILDLEKQKHQLQVRLWRDLVDLRQSVVDERREYRATRARMGYLAGGYGAWS